MTPSTQSANGSLADLLPRIGLLVASFGAFVSVAPALSQVAALALVGLIAHAVYPNLRERKARRIAAAAQFVCVAGAQASFLLSFWHTKLEPSRTLALNLAIAISIGAALLPRSINLGRPLILLATSLAAIFARNLAIPFTEHPVWPQIASAFAFTAILEVARSRRFDQRSNDLAPEFLCALTLVAIATWHSRSITLGLTLAAIALAAYLKRNHDRSVRDSHWEFAEKVPPPNGQRKASFAFAYVNLSLVALLVAGLSYGVLLKSPFWAENADWANRDVRRIAYDTRMLAESGKLDTPKLRSYLESLHIAKWTVWTIDAIQDELSKRSRDSRAVADSPIQSSPAHPPPPPPNRTDEQSIQNSRTSQLPDSSFVTNAPIQRQIPFPESSTENPRGPRNSPLPDWTGSGNRGDREMDLIRMMEISDSHFANTPQALFEPKEPPEPSIAIKESSSEPQARPKQKGPDLLDVSTHSRQVESMPRYGSRLMLADTLSAPIQQNALLVARVEKASDRPERLYLRRNQLESLLPDGFGRLDSSPELALPPNASNQPIDISESFQTSRKTAAKLSVTANPSIVGELPLPESFLRIRLASERPLAFWPLERRIEAPFSSEPFTYDVEGADLLPTSDNKLAEQNLSTERLALLTELPTGEDELTYLRSLATRLGGGRVDRDKFAANVARYFNRYHPYTYDVTIPSGSNHPAVRWLQSRSPGLCSNYAAAFVLLARAAKIPARVVSGFATDEYDAKAGVYVVRLINAHAWVEYLDESNRWIRFDPTPAVTKEETERKMANAPEPEPITELLRYRSSQEIADSPTDDQEPALRPVEIADLENAAPEPDPRIDELFESIGILNTENQLAAKAPPLEEPAPREPPASELTQILDTPRTATESTPLNDAIPAQTIPAVELPEASDQEPETIELPASTLESQPDETAASQSNRHLYWLAALALLVLLALVFAILKAGRPQSPMENRRKRQLTARRLAGRLLRKIERSEILSKRTEISDTKSELVAQRYGASPELSIVLRLEQDLKRLS